MCTVHLDLADMASIDIRPYDKGCFLAYDYLIRTGKGAGENNNNLHVLDHCGRIVSLAILWEDQEGGD